MPYNTFKKDNVNPPVGGLAPLRCLFILIPICSTLKSRNNGTSLATGTYRSIFDAHTCAKATVGRQEKRLQIISLFSQGVRTLSAGHVILPIPIASTYSIFSL